MVGVICTRMAKFGKKIFTVIRVLRHLKILTRRTRRSPQGVGGDSLPAPPTAVACPAHRA